MNSINQQLIIVTLLQLIILINCQYKINGRCGRPALPGEATLYQISPERSRFENNEKVQVLCKKNEFPGHKQQLVCKKGRWTGDKARCGKHIDAQVIHFDIFDCKSRYLQERLSQPINQSAHGAPGTPDLPRNSFHIMRIPEEVQISANGSTCYEWRIRFDRKVQIWFLLIDIWYTFLNDTQEIPTLRPIVSKYRTCALQNIHTQTMSGQVVAGHYYACDLNSDSDANKERQELVDSITVHINSSFKEEIGLEAVFIGDIYTTITNSMAIKPDCGQFEVQTIGVDFQVEPGYTYISCNDSFVDTKVYSNRKNMTFNKFGNPKPKFICNQNALWVGEWPVCTPIKKCSKEEVIDGKSDSMDIVEVGNVYYVNESHWFAINDSWVEYACNHDSGILVGKNIRSCMKNGKWSNKMPHCTGTTGISTFAIIGILLGVLLVFVLIVFLVFQIHSKRVNRELRQTRSELEGSQRKRFSEEFYADVNNENYYETTNDTFNLARKSMVYESVEYDNVSTPPELQPRYLTAPPGASTNVAPEYLVMFAVK